MAALSAASLAAANASAGKAAYDQKCKMCHGADGTPNPGMAKAMNIPDLKSGEVQGLSDADIKNIILSGKGKMRPVSGVSANQADDIAAYIHTMKK
jgi:mono/diheme cytochrome c family protein